MINGETLNVNIKTIWVDLWCQISLLYDHDTLFFDITDRNVLFMCIGNKSNAAN